MAFDKRELSEANSYVYQTRLAVRFQHVDAAGVVFFARFFEYVHEAYEAFLTAIGSPLSQVLREQVWAAPLTHVEADYFRPLRLGEEVLVELVAAEVEGSNLTLGWRLVVVPKPEQKYLVAAVQARHTFLRFDDFERTTVPDVILQALEPVLRMK